MNAGWIAFTIMLMDSCAIGMVVPAFTGLFETFTSDPQSVTQYFTYSISLFGLVQLFGAPLLGSLSDQWGRKRVAVLSLFGAGVGYAIMALSYFLPLIFVGRVFSALAGANLAVIAAYLADVSNPKNRSAHFGLMGAGFGMGFILGPFLGGQLASLGPRASFFFAAVLMLINTIFALVSMRETLSVGKKSDLKEMVHFVFRFVRLPKASWLLFSYFLIFLADQVYTSNWIPYTRYRFHWTASEIGASLSFAGICIVLGQGLVTRWLVRKIGERKTIFIGLIAYCIGFLGVMVAQESPYLYLALVSFSFAVVAGPCLQAVISHKVAAQEQGKLQGVLVSMVSLSTLLGPWLYNGLFLHFTGENVWCLLPGVAYLAASFFCFFCIVILLRCMPLFTAGN